MKNIDGYHLIIYIEKVMTTAKKSLLNLRVLSRKSISLDQLKKMLENLNQVVNERIAEDAQEKATSKEREEKIDIYRQMLLSDGLSIKDLLSAQEKSPKKDRIEYTAKYKYLNDNGDKKTWTGKGRMPKVLKIAVNNGAHLDDFIIL